MPPLDTGIDWASRPEPWSWIGPQFRHMCEQIAAGKAPKPPKEKRLAPVFIPAPVPVALVFEDAPKALRDHGSAGRILSHAVTRPADAARGETA